MKNTHIPLKTPLLTGIHDARDSRAFPSTSASWRRLSFLGCLALALFVAQPAKAALVTFDEVVNGSTNEIGPSATSAGFDFTSIHFHVIDSPTSCTFGGCVANGTQYAAEDAPTLAGPVTMTPSGGGTFSLVSFDGVGGHQEARKIEPAGRAPWSGGRPRGPTRGLGDAASIALALDGEDLGVMGDAIDERGGRGGVGEDRRPLAERQVGGEHEALAFVAAADDLKEEGGGPP